MCGIVGIIDLQGRPVDPTLLERMRDALRHRGPDAAGVYRAPGVGLAHRRLSIIDLASGQQPLSNEDGTVWISFNGEIYNFQTLRADLEARGHRFASQSDTEAIVHAFEEYGTDCLSRLRGMFALAIWDERQQTLLLARDRLGKKPLFYTEAGRCFVFASELQALLQHPAVERSIDPRGIDEYLTYGYIPAPRTVFRQVHKLLPGHFLTLSLPPHDGGGGQPRVECYWRLCYGPKRTLDEQQAAEGLLDVLGEAIRLRMIADVPLGALLSGGLDSSIVVALMSRMSSRPIKTFSIGFDEEDFDERPHARRVAERYGTDHHELVVRPRAVDVLSTLVRHYGEPYADSSAVPSYYVAQMTRQHVTVALNGDGGDECLAGYERYLGMQVARRFRRLPHLVRRLVVQPIAGWIPSSLPRRNRLRQAKRFVEGASLPAADCYLRWMSLFPASMKEVLYTPSFHAELDGYDGSQWLRGLFDQHPDETNDGLDAVLATDVASYLPYDLLVKMDIATMANSLEARSPFLDHKVMEYCAALPNRLKVRGGTLKYLLRKVSHDLLPPTTLSRRKMGFGVPVAAWIRGELREMIEDTLLASDARTREYVIPAGVRSLVEAHRRGEQDHSSPLWALLWLELWHREIVNH